MNTEQKARAWLVEKYYYGEESRKIDKGAEIITALLAEREALLGAAKSARRAVAYAAQSDIAMQPTYEELNQAIALCEKEHE